MGRYLRLSIVLAVLGTVLVLVAVSRMVVRTSTVLVPAEGGTYIEGIVGEPQWLNPVLASFNEVDQDLCQLLFRGLTRVDDHLRIVPDLAESWQVSGDGLVYTFTLRAGIRWQDGAPMTADDAAYTFRLMQSPAFPGPPHLSELWKQVEVEKVGPMQVRFTLSEPYAPFLDYTTMGLLPAHALADVEAADLLRQSFNSSPLSSGPFMLERIAEEEIVLWPNPYYEGPHPFLKELVLRFYPSESAVLAAYRDGEVDGIRLIPPEHLSEAAGLPDLNMYSAPRAEAVWLLLNTENPPLDDGRVRQALSAAIQRQAVIDEALHGQGIPLDGPLLPASWAYTPPESEAETDPDAARELLQQAGWTDSDGDGFVDKEGESLRLEIVVPDTPTSVGVAQQVALQWEDRIGVRATVTPVSQAELANAYLRPRDFQVALYRWMDISPDPDLYPFWHSTQTATDGQNFSLFSNRDADEIMEEARRTVDTVRRQELYARLQAILREEVPAIFLYQPVYTMGVRDKVQGIVLAPVYTPSDRFRSVADWYVYTKRVIASQADAAAQR